MEKSLTVTTESVFTHQFKLLTFIKGIGVRLTVFLIMTTGAFSHFENSNQLTKYPGLSPTYEQSGTSVNRHGHINRNGEERGEEVKESIVCCGLFSYTA